MDPMISNIDAHIVWPGVLGDWFPDITFAWIEEGLTDLSDFQDVDGLNVTLDTDVELVITGGADAERFEISQDGLTLKALQAFDSDAPDDGLLPGVLSVELALRDAEKNLFDQTRAYILVRPEDTLGEPYRDLVEQVMAEAEPYVAALLDADLEPGSAIDLVSEVLGVSPGVLETILSLDPDLILALVDLDELLTEEDRALFDKLGITAEEIVRALPELVDELDSFLESLQDGVLDQDVDGVANDLLLSPKEGGDLPTGLGYDLFVGLSDDDRVVYDGVRDDFVHDELGPGVVAIHKPGGDSDLLIGVEEVAFDDGSLVFNIPSDCVEFVYRMYEACYDRAPDLGGLLFWTGVVDRLKEEQSLQAAKDFLADQFVAADEFRDRFGEAPSFEDYIDGMYNHVLGRGADSEGKAWWVDGMNKGLGYDDILIAFAESHENVANTLEDVANGLWVV